MKKYKCVSKVELLIFIHGLYDVICKCSKQLKTKENEPRSCTKLYKFAK